ncbi:MAG TPA: hypothetical protein VIP08_09355 [Phenylobacterium sp.]|uniref:hypothetical protein n=1 Tax=Phenylobacterium sp. TaxID=1871053 RepID=UPI002F94BF5C
MNGPIKRDVGGRFVKGQCPNRNGRRGAKPQSSGMHRFPFDNREAAMRIAERKVKIKVAGKEEEMTLYEANLLQLGMSGAGGKQISAGRFIREVQAAAIENDRHTEMQTIFYEGWMESQREIERLKELLRDSGSVPPENGGVWTAPPPRWKQMVAEQAQRNGDPDEKATLNRE